MKRLYKSMTDKMICGVCGGLGEYFRLHGSLVRIAMILLTIFFPITFVIYILMCIFVKNKSY